MEHSIPDFRHFRRFALLVPIRGSSVLEDDAADRVTLPARFLDGGGCGEFSGEDRSVGALLEAACSRSEDRSRRLRFPGVLQYRRRYPDEFLNKSKTRGKGDYQIEYTPAPRITEADKINGKRAVDRRLYLLLYGNAYGTPSDKPVWHFPEKVYDSEETLRKRFFFKSQVIAKEEFNVGKCKDFAWVTKEELLEYFPDQAEFLNKMIVS